MSERFLDKIYRSNLDLSTSELYKSWAPSYENELNGNRYVTPKRCAEMLIKKVRNTDIRILDFGCGTGLSGEALHSLGFRQIEGLDLSAEMLKLAEKKSIYSRLLNDDLNTIVKLNQKYDAIIAAGVISPGHANPETINLALSLLSADGIFIFSLNDHALGHRRFFNKVKIILSHSSVEVLDEAYGDHIIDIGLKAKIFAVKSNTGKKM